MFGNFEQAVGALGGGNVHVDAGRDVVQLQVSLPTTGELTTPVGAVPGFADLVVRGGGDAANARSTRSAQASSFLSGPIAATTRLRSSTPFSSGAANSLHVTPQRPAERSISIRRASAGCTATRHDDPARRARIAAALSGSASPWTAAQINWALAHGFQGVPMDSARLVDAAAQAAERRRLVDAAVQRIAQGQSVLLYSALGPADPQIASTQHQIQTAGRSPSQIGKILGTQQGLILKEILAWFTISLTLFVF